MMNNYLKFIEIINLMASTPETQLSCFPEYVCRPDELLFTFEECFFILDVLLKCNKINEGIIKLVYDIDTCFDNFDSNDWTDMAVYFSSKWERIRNIAHNILAQLNMDLKSPNLFWISELRT